MESLAFIHTAVDHEDPNPAPELRLLENLNVSGSAVMGLAGAAVAVSLVGGAPEQAIAAPPVVASGSAGTEVEAIQQALGVAVDGHYGNQTEAAVTDFQIRHGLKQVDGVVGPETSAALGLDENYRPVGYVVTNTGIGLNIRQGPGLDHYIIGGAIDGAFLEQDYETVVYNDGYAWTPLYNGGWVASDYTQDYYPVSYDSGYDHCYTPCYEDSSYTPVSGGTAGGTVTTRSRIGLNVRSGPGLDFNRINGANEGSFVATDGNVIYRDGYAWQRTAAGGWVATDFLY